MNGLYACAACGHKSEAGRMWNLDRKVTSGKLEVLCGRDSHEARKRGYRVFRLAETLRRDAEREAELARIRSGREKFFARFGNVRLADAFKKASESANGNGNGHAPAVPVLPAPEIQEATI